ncbi:hypothetical protein HB778_15440 [Mesorhizobium huakuii]|uniref:ATP-binding cassette domain-containing protein n=1 Tax=Mesorhizobium huakuii TaxID=28104 RepID=A0A7G6SL52_9HYPH|nr:hypothetical protein HB778_15440 [Mesorhizobium huakuii]
MTNIGDDGARPHNKAPSGQETAAIVGDLQELAGLGKAAGRKFPHEFSGGQRQRISIARAREPLRLMPRL